MLKQSHSDDSLVHRTVTIINLAVGGKETPAGWGGGGGGGGGSSTPSLFPMPIASNILENGLV